MGGFLCKPQSVNVFSRNIKKIVDDRKLRMKMSVYNLNRVKKFDLEKIKTMMCQIYFENNEW